MEKQIHLFNTPQFYLEYMKNWLAHKKKENAPRSEVAVVEDLTKLVEVAVSSLTPHPAVHGNDKN